ncbi:MAG TPA: aminopeptidase P family N-terminal domain-containing protein [Kiloniellaceae bacterium]
MTERLAGIGQEHDTRIAAVRALMLERRLDVALVSAPENIFYLTGLDHWGYFAPHMLIVPLQGEVVLVTRAMERVTVANQVRNARRGQHGQAAANRYSCFHFFVSLS